MSHVCQPKVMLLNFLDMLKMYIPCELHHVVSYVQCWCMSEMAFCNCLHVPPIAPLIAQLFMASMQFAEITVQTVFINVIIEL